MERWRGQTDRGEWHVDLLWLEPLPPFPGDSWRVDWRLLTGLRNSQTFPAGDTAEADARRFCAAKRDELPPVEWVNLSEIDIRRPNPAVPGQDPPP